MTDETIRLILDMGQSGANVAQVRAELDKLKGSVQTTADTYDVLERQVGEYEVMERRVIETTQVVVQAQAIQGSVLEQLGIRFGTTAIAAGEVGQSMGKTGQFGRGIQQASYAVQDFTSVMGTQGLGGAFRSIQNNIPIMLASLGAGQGLAGILSIVSVGVGLLIDNWGSLTGMWNKEETKKEADRQKDLAESIENTRKAAEKLAGTHPAEQREEESGLKRAVQEFGGPAVMKELSEALKTRGDFGPEANQAMAKNFFANLMQGDRKAFGLLQELPLRGEVGEVLRGGRTPREQEQIDRARAARESQQLEAAKEAAAKRDEAKAAEAQREKLQQAEGVRAADAATEQTMARIRQRERQQEIATNVAGLPQGRPRGQPSIHDISEAGGFRAVEGVRRGLEEQTGERVSMQQALNFMKRQNQELLRAQSEFGAAVMDAVGGQQDQVMMLRRQTAEIRQRAQGAANMGGPH